MDFDAVKDNILGKTTELNLSDEELAKAKSTFGEKDGKTIVGVQKHTKARKVILEPQEEGQEEVVTFEEETQVTETTY